ncbi:uncharacterized protein LOC110959929 [Tachysurus ichikawai]
MLLVLFTRWCIKVVFRKGTLGYLLQEPTEEARVIKDNPTLQDKSAPKKEELVRQDALAMVRQRGGDASDKTEVLGEYILQFGKYKGKFFRWLLQNDMGYTIYLIKNLQQEEAMGVFTSEGPSKSSLLSFCNYACSINEIQSLLSYVSKNPGVPAASSESDQLVGFGAHAKSTWQEIWNRADGYASFILGATCVPKKRMYKLQQYLRNQVQSARPSVIASSAASKPTEMDDDDELECDAEHLPLQATVAVLINLCPWLFSVQPSSSATDKGPLPQPLDYDYDIREWKCSHQQKIWMKTELESMGLWSEQPHEDSRWHLTPQPELIGTISDLPSPKYFQLHPFFGCLACGQPKSRYENDGSSVHFFLSTRPCQIFLLLYKGLQSLQWRRTNKPQNAISRLYGNRVLSEGTCVHKETGGREKTAKVQKA